MTVTTMQAIENIPVIEEVPDELEREVSRSRDLAVPLCVAAVRCEEPHALARQLKRHLRVTDTVHRISEDALLVIMPFTEPGNAMSVMSAACGESEWAVVPLSHEMGSGKDLYEAAVGKFEKLQERSVA